MKTPRCLTYRNIRHGCIFGGRFEFHASRPRDKATAARNRLADDTSYICCYRECMLTTHSILTPVHLLKDVRLSNYWMDGITTPLTQKIIVPSTHPPPPLPRLHTPEVTSIF